MDLHGQVVLVTGGGRGLGRALALALANAGATVVVVSRTESQVRETVRLVEQNGGKAVAMGADVTDRAAVEQLVAQIEGTVGPVDLLINNAGTFRALGPIAELDPEEWWREVETNLKGPYLCTRLALPKMLQRGRGRIVNVVSAAGLQAIDTISAYNVSKTALIRLTENIDIEARHQGVLAFAIDPGTVRTPLSDYVVESDTIRQRAPQVQHWFQRLYADGLDTPIEKSVALVMAIASGRADRLSGRYLSVTDDLETLLQRVEQIGEQDLHKLRLMG